MVGLLLILAIGYVVSALVVFFFFPAESDDVPPSTVTLETTYTLNPP